MDKFNYKKSLGQNFLQDKNILTNIVKCAGIDGNSLLQAVETAVEMNNNGDYGIPVPDYVDKNVSDKVVKLIQSYTGVVNKMVWRKDV